MAIDEDFCVATTTLLLYKDLRMRPDRSFSEQPLPSFKDREINALLAPNPISLHAVNGWRGPGAVAIAIAHFAIATDIIPARQLQPIALLVDLFFVFSGLLMTQVYKDKLRSAAAIPEYLIRRFGRIWPVQAATLAILVGYELMKLVAQSLTGLHFSSPPFSSDSLNLVAAIPTNLLLVHSLGIHDRETWNFPSWSLSVEFVTYALFASFCLATPVVRRCLSCLTIAVSIVILVTVAPYHMRSTYDYGLFRCLAGFFAGSLCFEALMRWRLPAWPLPTFFETLAVALVIVWMITCRDTWLVFAAPFVFVGFVAAFYQARGLLSRLLSTKPVCFMAELSFSIYMVHGVVLILLMAGLHQYERVSGAHLFTSIPSPFVGYPGAPHTIKVLHLGSVLSTCAVVTLYLLIVSLLSFAVFKFVEIPGRAFFNTLANRVRVLAPLVPPMASDRDTLGAR